MKILHSILSSILLLVGSFLLSRSPDIGANLQGFYAGFAIASGGYLGLLRWGLPARKRGSQKGSSHSRDPSIGVAR